MIRLLPVLTLLAAGCPKQLPVPTASVVPSAETVFAAYHQAIGGVEAMSPTTVHSTMEADMNGMVVTVDAYMLPPSSMLVRTALPGVGAIEQGYDGTHGWELNPITGVRLLGGDELVSLAEAADQDIALDYAKLYPQAEAFGPENFEGEDAWRVEAVKPSGQATTLWFSVDTGLELGSRETSKTDMGELLVTSLQGDYREFSGVLLPTRLEQRMGDTMTVVMKVTAIERGIPLDPITPPPEVAELIAERAEDAGVKTP